MSNEEYWDAYLGVDLDQVDPDIDLIIGFEEERQARKLIMIPSESMAPRAVRPGAGQRVQQRLRRGLSPAAHDARRGVDAARHAPPTGLLSPLRRPPLLQGRGLCPLCRDAGPAPVPRTVLPTSGWGASDIYVNVQPLSGAAANLAVYDTVVDVGDVVMGMDLYQGGHLTHGSEFNFSGKRYHVVSYGVSKRTGKLDYDEIRDLAREHKPKMIIAGYHLLSLGARLGGLCRHRPRGGRRAAGRHQPPGRHGHRRRLPQPGGHRRRDHLYHPQDPLRPARRGHHDAPTRSWPTRSTWPSFPASRAARTPRSSRPWPWPSRSPRQSRSGGCSGRSRRTPPPWPRACRSAAWSWPTAAPTPISACST